MTAKSEKDSGNTGIAGVFGASGAAETPADPTVFRPECHQQVPLLLLHVVPGRSPKIHSPAAVAALAKEIEADGQIEAIILCDHPTERGFQVVHGHRRLAALRLLGRTHAVCDFKPTMTPEQADRICFALQRERLSTWEMLCDVQRRRAENPKVTVEELSSATGYPRLRAMVMISQRVDPDLVCKLRLGDCFDRLLECCRIEPDAPDLIRYEAQRKWWAEGPPKQKRVSKPGRWHLRRAIARIEATGKMGRVVVEPKIKRAVLRLLRFVDRETVGTVPQRGKRYRVPAPRAA